MLESIYNWLTGQGIGDSNAQILTKWIATVAVILLSILVNWIAKHLIVAGLRIMVTRSKFKWDDRLADRKVFTKLSHLAPALVLYHFLTAIWVDSPNVVSRIDIGIKIYYVVIGLWVIDSLLNALLDIYRSFQWSKQVPIKSFLQVIKLVLYFLAGVLILSYVAGRSPLYFISGLGAFAAVLMLVFKDAILGFAAGIQLTTNRMLAVGDWIEMPKYGADGDLLEITLTTVKIRNFDKTITTIPTYALISESFKNWRGMTESSGRRIKRGLLIDMNTIQFCDEEMLARFSKIQYISEYLDRKRRELSEHNLSRKVDNASLANGRRLTNVGTFRAYVEAYLRNHEMISKELTFLVRQLAPTSEGLPIEIYVFSKDKRWVQYEAIQADIFDHILAVIREFDLQVYQQPSGSDIGKLIQPGRAETG